MSLRATRWLIALPATMLREPSFLHVYEDGSTEFAADHRRALRFASKQAAERFGTDHLLVGFYAEEWAAADLAPNDPEIEDDQDQDEELAA